MLVFPQRDRQTGLFLFRALRELGATVKAFDPRLQMKWRIPRVSAKFKPELILCNREPGIYKHLLKVKSMGNSPKMVCWNLDKRHSVKEFGADLLQLFNLMDVFYTIALGDIPNYRKICPNTNVRHLQQGIDCSTHHDEELTIDEHKKYDCDIMFAGDLRNKVHWGRLELIEYIKERGYNIRIFGGKNAIYDSEHNKACGCAKICLGHNGVSHVAVSMSVRDYKIMGAGGVLLTEWCPGIEEWFRCRDTGEPMCFTYKSNEECVEMIEYIISHREKAARIAKNAQKEVHLRHRYVDRVRQILEDTGLLR